MFTEHIRECQQYTDYYLCKKHKCDLKYCMETYSLVVVVFLNCTTLTGMDSCLFKALLHLLQQRCLKDIKDTYSSKKNKATKNHIIKMTSQMGSKELTSGGLMYLQLHYEVQVVWALIDVLQSHYILMLYPAEGEKKIHFSCCQLLFISAQATNEV